jgi:hypothetical protein
MTRPSPFIHQNFTDDLSGGFHVRAIACGEYRHCDGHAFRLRGYVDARLC